MADPTAVPEGLATAVACVDRELRMRLACYPRWVAQKKMTQRKADEELAGMRLVRQMLIEGAAQEGEHGPFLGIKGRAALDDLMRELPPCP